MDNNELNPEIEDQARKLCQQISVSHNLDEEIQQELYTHVEDKLLGYLNGEVPVTQDDALILVREHFGDPGTIKSLMHDVHIEEVTLSQARRRAAALIMTMLFALGLGVLMNAMTLGLHYFRFVRMTGAEVAQAESDLRILYGLGEMNAFVSMTIYIVPSVVAILGPWIFLYRWKRDGGTLRERWFYRWNGAKLTVAIIAIFALDAVIPYFTPTWLYFNSQAAAYTFMTTLFLLSAAQCYMWIWWCDSAPRTKRNVLNSALLWLLYKVVVVVVPQANGTIVAHDPGLVDFYHQPPAHLISLYSRPFLDTPFFTQVAWRMPPLTSWPSVIPSITVSVVASLIAYTAYRLYRSRRDRNLRLASAEHFDDLD